MSFVKLMVLVIGMILSAQIASANDTYARGSLAGHCALLVNGDFSINNNGVLFSDGSKVNAADGSGGATWPVVSCPNKGTNTAMKCAPGWKVALQGISQANCKADNSPGLCNVYMIVQQCVKL